MEMRPAKNKKTVNKKTVERVKEVKCLWGC